MGRGGLGGGRGEGYSEGHISSGRKPWDTCHSSVTSQAVRKSRLMETGKYFRKKNLQASRLKVKS